MNIFDLKKELENQGKFVSLTNHFPQLVGANFEIYTPLVDGQFISSWLINEDKVEYCGCSLTGTANYKEMIFADRNHIVKVLRIINK